MISGNNKNPLDVLIIGFGPHAESKYVLAIKHLQSIYHIKLSGIADDTEKRNSTIEFINKCGPDNDLEYISAPKRKEGKGRQQRNKKQYFFKRIKNDS